MSNTPDIVTPLYENGEHLFLTYSVQRKVRACSKDAEMTILHRLDAPAVEWEYGMEEWWQNGHLHRLDGPAITLPDKGTTWFFLGKLHRIDGPAVESKYGHKQWWLHGKRHRVDGPAEIQADGVEKWFLFGEKTTQEELFVFNNLLLENLQGKEIEDVPYDVLHNMFIAFRHDQ